MNLRGRKILFDANKLWVRSLEITTFFTFAIDSNKILYFRYMLIHILWLYLHCFVIAIYTYRNKQDQDRRFRCRPCESKNASNFLFLIECQSRTYIIVNVPVYWHYSRYSVVGSIRKNKKYTILTILNLIL